jgi:hypothetical protein
MHAAMKAVDAGRRLAKVGELTLLLSSAFSSSPAACFRPVSAVLHERALSTWTSRSPFRGPSQQRRSHEKASLFIRYQTSRSNYSTSTPSSPAMDRHRQEVSRISATVKSFHDRGEKFRIFHGSTNSTRKSALGRDPKKVVDTSRLNHVLHVDKDKRTALVEPNVPMDRLVEATLEHGLIPPVVMEFPGITAGGGYSGTSGESSSFKHGFFDRTLLSVEMVLADGEVITCSETENADLFGGAAGAVGTFGLESLVGMYP